MLWGISEMVNATAFKPRPLCSAPLKTFLVGISGALWRTESHFLSRNVFWENAVGYLRNSECYSFETCAIVFQHPLKLTSRDFWSSRNERKSLSKLKHVFQKCSSVSQKLWMLELSNLCHCVQHPENLLIKISWALWTMESHFPRKNMFWENAVEYLRNGESYSFQTCAILFSIPENLLVQISGALGTTDSHF